MTMTFLDILRAFLYLLTALECFILARDYNFGYDKIKGSHIIRALSRLFLSLAISFAYFCFTPILKIYAPDAYKISTALAFIPIAFIIYSLEKFRYWSLNQKEK